MKQAWEDKRFRPWKKRGWKPYLTGKEMLKEVSNLRVGWMVWWRSILPCLILDAFVSWLLEIHTVQTSLFMLPIFFFLLNRAGKTVARREYEFETPYFIGWHIFWRTILPSLPIGMVGLYLSSVTEWSGALTVVWLIYLPVSVFLSILIVGWATNRAIEELLSS